MSQGSPIPKIRFLGQNVLFCLLTDRHTHTHTHTHRHTQTDTKVSTKDTLSRFHECFLQPTIKDRSNITICSIVECCVRWCNFSNEWHFQNVTTTCQHLKRINYVLRIPPTSFLFKLHEVKSEFCVNKRPRLNFSISIDTHPDRYRLILHNLSIIALTQLNAN